MHRKNLREDCSLWHALLYYRLYTDSHPRFAAFLEEEMRPCISA